MMPGVDGTRLCRRVRDELPGYIYIVLITGTGSSYAAYKGSIALALLMLPVVIRSAEVVLMLVPNALRESALALGAPRWRVIGMLKPSLPEGRLRSISPCRISRRRQMSSWCSTLTRARTTRSTRSTTSQRRAIST